MTYELRFERVIEASPEVVFDLFTEHEGQLAFYQGPEPAWIVVRVATCERAGSGTSNLGRPKINSIDTATSSKRSTGRIEYK